MPLPPPSFGKRLYRFFRGSPRMSRRRRVLIIGVSVLAFVVCLLVCGYGKYVRVMGHVGSLRQHLWSLEARGQGELLASVQGGELESLQGELVSMGDELRALKAELGPAVAVAPYLGWLPGVGSDVAAAPDLLEMGIGMSNAADLVLTGLSPLAVLFEESEGAASDLSAGEVLAQVLWDGRSSFEAARSDLEDVEARRERIDEERLSPKVGQLVLRLDKYVALFDTGVEGLLAAPYLLGAESPRTYLLLAQNENELRATGGFISSVALLRVRDGKIEDLDFRDSYAVDDLSNPHPAPPEALERYMLSQLWLLRDANWYPDFPTTAQIASELYELDQGVSVDGVIAADLVAVEALVEVLGPIQLEEYGQEVTGANVMDLMREYWASPAGEGQTGDWWSHRKDFMGELLGAMMTRLQSDVGSLDLAGLLGVARRGLEEKHVLIHVNDPVVSQILAANGWDGAVRADVGDFLMVVDTNMGFNKVNPNVENAVEYLVSLDDAEDATGRLSITYHNTSGDGAGECVQESVYPPTYEEMMEGCYWDYLRVYVPEGAELLDGPDLTLPEGSLWAQDNGVAGAPLDTEVAVETGKNVLASFFVVAPGERREMVYVYRLPESILEQRGSATVYRLLVQKQPGTLAVPLRVEVELPPGSVVVSSSPEPASSTDGRVTFETDLRTDREFEIAFR
jgi:hypothetical protein